MLIGSVAHFEAIVGRIGEIIAARAGEQWPDAELSIPVPGGPNERW
jgi:hypothetical protein